MPKFTFKKEPKEKGLAGVARPYPPTAIKLDGKEVGAIRPPSHWSARKAWQIWFMVDGKAYPEDNCNWHWIMLPSMPKNEPAARAVVLAAADWILDLYDLRAAED